MNARNRRLTVGRSRTRKRSDDPERLLDFLGKHVGVDTIGPPPGFLSPDVLLCSGMKRRRRFFNASEVREG
jgi:hypothetical protein